MSRIRMLFLAFFGSYLILLFLFAVYVDAKVMIGDQAESVTMHAHVNLMKYAIGFSLIPFLIEYIWTWQSASRMAKRENEIQRLKEEITALRGTVPANKK